MTTTTLPTITHRITYDATTRDYACYVSVGGDPEQYIGSADTYHAGELKCLAYKRDLLESDIFTPATTLDGQCGDCGAALDSMGLCGCQDGTEVYIETATDLRSLLTENSTDPGAEADAVLAALHTRPDPLSCICGAPVPAAGLLCMNCFEAAILWTLWKHDSTVFVERLRQQRSRLNEMAERLATYLNAKNKSSLGTDSILAMWRQLLGDGEPPGPRFYVVARQRVATWPDEQPMRCPICKARRSRLHKCAICGEKRCGCCSIKAIQNDVRTCCYFGDGHVCRDENRRRHKAREAGAA